MNVKTKFKNVLSYAASMEKWVNDSLQGSPLEYTFASDFAIADWFGEKSVLETYETVKKEWLSDYVAFTEVVISLNMLSWANHTLTELGFEDREKFTKLYSELYYTAMDDFYDKYTGNVTACDHFFKMTD